MSIINDGSKNLLLLLLNQFLTRFLTFFLNILTVRHVGAVAFGIASIHLYFLYTTILFIAREPFRRATLQVGFRSIPLQSPPFQQYSSSAVSYQLSLLATLRTITYIIFPVGIGLAISLSYVYILNPPEFDTTTSISITPSALSFTTLIPIFFGFKHHPITTIEWYHIGVALFAISAIVELCSEHLYLHITRLGLTKVRVTLETIANITRCIITYVIVLALNWNNELNTATAILAYGLGQLSFSTSLTLGYFVYYFYHIIKRSPHLFISHQSISETIARSHHTSKHANQQDNFKTKSALDHLENTSCLLFSSVSQLFPFLPQYSIFNPFSTLLFDFELLSWSRAFALQSLFKHLLTEGEKMVLVTLSQFTPEQNGAYALVVNLGGLFVRLILQPIEENSQQIFSAYHRDIQYYSQTLMRLGPTKDGGIDTKDRSEFSKVELSTTGQSKPAIPTVQSQVSNKQATNETVHGDVGSMIQQRSTRVYSPSPSGIQLRQQSQPIQRHTQHHTKNEDACNHYHKLIHLKNQLKSKLKRALLLASYIGLTLGTFGPPMSYSAIRIIYGEQWSEDTSAPAVLAMYSLAQFVFALNGIAEGFLFSTMQTTSALYNANIIMVLCTLVYFATMVIFTRTGVLLESFGTQGLIIANVFAMVLRIFYAFLHIRSYFEPSSTESELLVPVPTKIDNQKENKENGQDKDDGRQRSDVDHDEQTPLLPLLPTQLSFTSLICCCFPSRIPRWFLFFCLLYSHLVVTYFLFPSILGFNEMGLNVFKMIARSSQFFVTDAVPYNEPRQPHHIGPDYIQRYVAPPLRQHLMAIGYILPLFILLVIFILKFDRHRVSQG